MRELLTNYPPYPAILWFDYPTDDMTPDLASKIVTLLNQYPNLIRNNRLGGGYPGDTATPEQHIPPEGYPGNVWENCMTMNDTWGYKSGDRNLKSTETLLHNLIDIAGKGGNYLLNVGPDADGVIPQDQADRLTEIGHWLTVNGEAIYGSGPTHFGGAPRYSNPAESDWRCTTKPGKLFVHLFQWPGATFTLPGVKGKVTRAYLLANRRAPLKVSQSGEQLTVTLPAQAPDPLASVLVLEVKDGSGAPGA